jgi:hypothetical protein
MLKPMLRRTLLLVFVVIGFAVLNYFAPLQPLSVLFDLCLVAVVAGLLSLIYPLRFLDIRSRKIASLVVLVALVAGVCTLLWPASLVVQPARQSLLDEYMPTHEVNEFHSELVHASSGRIYSAMKETTFAEVKVFSVLMLIRRAAAGKFATVQGTDVPIFTLLSRKGSGFVLLAEDPEREIVLGTAGRFWSTGAARSVQTRSDFLAFDEPGSARSVFNIKLEDMGNGWTHVTTETRALGNDPSARRKMAAYWRVIYPGSATIRRMWLRAIKARAERG